MSVASFLETSSGRRLAYILSEGQGPTIVFCGGFKSDMQGGKALALEAFCQARGQRFIRFDYSGHGQSSGEFIEGTIGDWFADALAIIDTFAGEKFVIVGSSMGGWIALLVALARKERVLGLLGVASAPDFTEALIWKQLTDEQKRLMQTNGHLPIPSCYDQDPYLVSYKLIEEGRKHLLLTAPVDITVPVRLIHGSHDQDVPWQVSAELLSKITSKDATLTLIRDGDHRLSTPYYLGLLTEGLSGLLAAIEKA